MFRLKVKRSIRCCAIYAAVTKFVVHFIVGLQCLNQDYIITLHRLQFVQMAGTKISEQKPSLRSWILDISRIKTALQYAYWLCSNFQNFDLPSNVTLHLS
jgi:hypothetical protein